MQGRKGKRGEKKEKTREEKEGSKGSSRAHDLTQQRSEGAEADLRRRIKRTGSISILCLFSPTLAFSKQAVEEPTKDWSAAEGNLGKIKSKSSLEAMPQDGSSQLKGMSVKSKVTS